MNTPFATRLCSLVAVLALPSCQSPEPEPADRKFGPSGLAKVPGRPVIDWKTDHEGIREFESQHLDQVPTLLPGTFPPEEAEGAVLPFMGAHEGLFAGRRVFEIGTGSGIISLLAAQLGAASVVCTDISETAIANVRSNAERMGFGDIIDARLVPESDISAYSVIRDGETFDTIISNPPYALDLDAEHNTALVDNGDLGLSILRGLPDHLADGGTVALFYNTLFYHMVMVKFARHLGYHVRNHMPMALSGWAMESLFNLYMERLLEREGLPKEDLNLRFYWEELPLALIQAPSRQLNLFKPGFQSDDYFPGFLIVTREKPGAKDEESIPAAK